MLLVGCQRQGVAYLVAEAVPEAFNQVQPFVPREAAQIDRLAIKLESMAMTWLGGLLMLWALSVGGCFRPLLPAPPPVKIDPNARFDSTSRDAIVVFGFYGQFNIQIIDGVDDGVNWLCGAGPGLIWRVRADNGFVAVRLPARTGKNKYAIGRIDAVGGLAHAGPQTRWLTWDFNSHPARPIWVFNAEPGKVNYVGTLRVTWAGDAPQIDEDTEVTPQQADDFVTQTFPNIRDHVVTRPMQWIYTGLDCTGHWFVD